VFGLLDVVQGTIVEFVRIARNTGVLELPCCPLLMEGSDPTKGTARVCCLTSLCTAPTADM
jgi:hypothetical protein